MANKTQEESEAPAKVYQIDALADKLDGIEKLILNQSRTYITKDELKLSQQPQDAEIQTIRDKQRSWAKGAWVVVGTVATLLADNIWQLIVNSGRVH